MFNKGNKLLWCLVCLLMILWFMEGTSLVLSGFAQARLVVVVLVPVVFECVYSLLFVGLNV